MNLWKKVNELGESKAANQKSSCMPDPDAEELSENEWKDLEDEFNKLFTAK